MDVFFSTIYYWFSGLYGQNLDYYLAGYNSETGLYDYAALYVPIVLTMIVLTASICGSYYYILNHPHLNRWWHWLIAGGITAVLNLFIGGAWVSSHYNDGLIPDDLLYDPTTGKEVLSIFDCWMFGLANGILAFVCFAILSTIIKRWSRNCRHTPWKSIFPKRNK